MTSHDTNGERMVATDGTAPSRGGERRIVVGVDGSESSCEALRFAVHQAGLTGAEVHAVTAWEVPYAFAAPGPVLIDWVGLAGARLEEAIGSTLPAEQRDRVRRLVRQGHPSPVLRRLAQDAEMLVIGSRGHGGFVGLLLGSVGQYLVTHATCPTVVVHLDDLPVAQDEPREVEESPATAAVGP